MFPHVVLSAAAVESCGGVRMPLLYSGVLLLGHVDAFLATLGMAKWLIQAGYGPPYGLLQGSLEGLQDTPPREETVVAK